MSSKSLLTSPLSASVSRATSSSRKANGHSQAGSSTSRKNSPRGNMAKMESVRKGPVSEI
eukprot:2206519-Rhodomonas_salina.2